MYINHDKKLIYLAHPRTASVATSTALKKVGFKKMEPPSDHHSQLWDEGTPATEQNRDDWTVFTTVRNHWDTAVSWAFRHFGKSIEDQTFDAGMYYETFRANSWVKDHTIWHLHSDDADVILRYENLEDDLKKILSDFGVEMPPLYRHNVSHKREGRHYSNFHTESSRKYIAERFSDEIERFNYKYKEKK